MAEPGIRHERIDACDLSRRGLMGRDAGTREVPVAAVREPGPEGAGNGCWRKRTVAAASFRGLVLVRIVSSLVPERAPLASREIARLEDREGAAHHFIPRPRGSAFTMRASACWQ